MQKFVKWLEDAIFYEVYPQSFYDSNSDGIGDLKGIEKKLDYIKELGCNAIWINPCFKSPFYDAGYDISDYYTIAPRYGTNEDMKSLFRSAHEKGMHILLDLVPGHTSVEHPWFEKSSMDERNEYTDRYVWTDSVWDSPIGKIDDLKGYIRGYSERDGVCASNFFTHQPALNYGFANPDPDEPWQLPCDAPGPRATFEEMKNVMRFWLSMGCDGFRVDMAYSLVKNDPGHKATIELWKEVRQFLDKEYPEAVLIAEWGVPDESIEGGFHMDFLLHFADSHYLDLFRTDNPYFSMSNNVSLNEFVDKYTDLLTQTAGRGLICIPSGNHDMERMSYYLDEQEQKLAFAFLLSMPGAPFIYYGDEIGMKYLNWLPSKEGGYYRTGSRTPMQWDSTVNSGFSAASSNELYLPMDPSTDRPTVSKMQSCSQSLWNEIRRLIEIRRKYSALGNMAEIEFLESDNPLIYRRFTNDQSIRVIINTTSQKKSISNVCGNEIYKIGGNAIIEDAVCTIDPGTVVFILE